MPRGSPVETAARPRRRVLAGLALLAAAALLWVNGTWLLASGYAQVGAEQRARNPGSAQAHAASAAAARLAPWRAAYRSDLAWSLAATGSAEDTGAVFLEALRDSPGDPFAWQEYAQLLARRGDFGPGLLRASAESNALAPNSPSIQGHNALLGLRYWFLAGEAVHEEWLRSIRWQLAHHRRYFIDAVMYRRLWPTLCATELGTSDLQWWCAQVRQAAVACARPALLNAGQRKWCTSQWLLREPAQ